MQESSKSIFGKIKDIRYVTRYLVGDGIDIGAGNDSIQLYQELFPLIKTCRSWDIPDGDAQYVSSIKNETLDFVHSSHCLEHLIDPLIALNNWIRILKPGGHLVCLIPDEDLYEQGVFPSTFNSDHKHTFTIYKKKSWCPQSINLIQLLAAVSFDIEILKIEQLNATFRYNFDQLDAYGRADQSLTPVAECGIEFILKKSTVLK